LAAPHGTGTRQTSEVLWSPILDGRLVQEKTIMNDINSLASAANRRPNIEPTTMVSPAAGAYITLVNQLFGSKGPLASYRLQSIELNGNEFTVGVAGAWRSPVAIAISEIIERYAARDVNTQGWKLKVTDTSNEESVRG
jgi:hypothetical protein